MPAKSSSTRYGGVSVTIHWLSALLIFGLIATGFRAAQFEQAAAKATVLQIHIPIAILAFVLTLIRIGWWWFADNKPPSIPMPKWQDRASRAVHLLFYIVILGMVSSGIGMMVLSDAGPIIFGAEPGALPDFWEYAPRYPHGIGARIIAVLVAIHAGAAIYHQFVKRDGLLRRMWY